MHGSYEQFYRTGTVEEISKKLILSADWQAKFLAAPMDHALMFKPALWKNLLDQYLDGIAKLRNS